MLHQNSQIINCINLNLAPDSPFLVKKKELEFSSLNFIDGDMVKIPLRPKAQLYQQMFAVKKKYQQIFHVNDTVST